MNASQPPLVSPVTVNDLEYSATHAAASFSALVSGNGLSTSAKFQIGTTTNYGTDILAPLGLGNTALQQVQSPRITLQPNTTYHCRLTATNAAGTTNGGDTTFITGPSPSAPAPPPADLGRGYYSGLLDVGADGPDGLVTLFVSATGAMTGKVSFHGVTKGFQATFHNDTAQVGFAGWASLILARNPAGGIDLTFGDFSGHAENSPYSADSPAPMRGSYTVLLPPDPAHAGDAAFPQGTGFATLRVNQLGVVHGVGRVGDGGVLAFDSSVHGDGTLPCYDGLYTAPFGSIGGTLTFRDLAGSDLDGTLSWSKPTPSAVKVGHGALVGGFGNLRVPAIGSLYHPTATPLQMLNYSNTHRATVTFHDGGLTAPMSGTATVRQVLSAFVTPPMQSLVFSPEDGVISGALRSATGSGAPRPFFGVVFQKQNRGAGLFKSAGATGGFDYTPQP